MQELSLSYGSPERINIWFRFQLSSSSSANIVFELLLLSPFFRHRIPEILRRFLISIESLFFGGGSEYQFSTS